jgi:hypothetical protein
MTALIKGKKERSPEQVYGSEQDIESFEYKPITPHHQ